MTKLNLFDEFERSVFGDTVGFESLFNRLRSLPGTEHYPYDIEQTDDDHFKITMAIAGFRRDDIEVSVANRRLTIHSLETKPSDEIHHYIHHGISHTSFSRSFELGENIRAVGANMHDGLLSVYLVRETPEREQPKKIPIVDRRPPRTEGATLENSTRFE